MAKTDIRYQKSFHSSFKTGDKIKVTREKYALIGIYKNWEQEYLTAFYTIGRTDLDDSHGQVEIIKGTKNVTIVEYQWFNEELTKRKIQKL